MVISSHKSRISAREVRQWVVLEFVVAYLVLLNRHEIVRGHKHLLFGDFVVQERYFHVSVSERQPFRQLAQGCQSHYGVLQRDQRG